MTKYSRGLTKEDIEKIGNSVVGKTLGELGDFKYNLDDFNYKGGVGVLMEENVFQYGANSASEPDFKEAGIELKTSPVKLNKNGTYSAKERLVLNIINYMEEYSKTFETSSFWQKNKRLYIMFYLWEEGKPRKDYRVLMNILYDYPEEDLLIIKQDWEYIINKIRAGKAHELSEADTLYLGACPKGKDSNSLRKQPFSDIPAMQRAFCLKNSYMTSIVRRSLSNEKVNNIISIKELKNDSFKDALLKRVKKYIGMSVDELSQLFGINPNLKNKNEKIFGRMLGIKGNINETDEFKKANIVCKTVRLKQNKSIEQSMSFPPFKFTEIVGEEWEDSTLRNYFTQNKYLFIIFEEKAGLFYFQGIKLWNMPLDIIDTHLKYVWQKTKDIISNGDIIKEHRSNKSGKLITYNNFPGIGDNPVAHVRPHGQNKNDVYDLPVPDKLTGCTKFTKQCFWLNNKYVLNVILEVEKL